MDWRERALCRGFDPEIWFPVDERPESEGVQYAKSLCALCPVRVRAECAAFALRAGLDDGIFGGLTPDERRTAKRRSAHPARSA